MSRQNRLTAAPDSRVGSITRQLRDIAYRKGPEAKLPTLRELCETFEASQTTVIGALDNLEAQNVIYRKDRSGIFVSPTINQRHIALVLGSSYFLMPDTSPFWNLLWALCMKRAAERASAADEMLSVHLAMPSEDQNTIQQPLINQIQEGQVDGVLAIGLTHRDYLWISERVPYVCFGGNGFPMVALDFETLLRLGVQSLSDNGCRRIGCWRPVPIYMPSVEGAIPSPEAADRERTMFQRILESFGLPYHDELVYDPHRVGWDIGIKNHEQGYRLALNWLASPAGTRADGLVISDDMMTVGALTAFLYNGVRIGEDIKIATHANAGSPVLFGHEQHLILIEFRPMDIVNDMFGQLDAQFEKQEIPHDHTQWITPRLR